MILADTSAWIELLRDTGSRAAAAMEAAQVREELVTTETVIGELLLGEPHAPRRAALLERLRLLPVLSLGGLSGFIEASELYLSCRRAGVTVRKYTDCLIAVPAIRADAVVLHADRDFTEMARVCPLQVVEL